MYINSQETLARRSSFDRFSALLIICYFHISVTILFLCIKIFIYIKIFICIKILFVCLLSSFYFFFFL